MPIIRSGNSYSPETRLHNLKKKYSVHFLKKINCGEINSFKTPLSLKIEQRGKIVEFYLEAKFLVMVQGAYRQNITCTSADLLIAQPLKSPLGNTYEAYQVKCVKE